jgi:hypothetical protein
VPIIDLQRRLAEKGRIRLGQKKATANGKTYPAKLDRLRFTSPDRVVVDALADRYGGDVSPWEGQWEVVTEARVIDVMLIPSAMGFSQWYEDWSGAVCRKRCDGVTDHVRDVTCDCDPDARTCKTTTRLSVILPDLAGLGVWRLETHGYNAAVEIAAAVEMVELAAGAGAMIPARLRLEQRTVKRLIGEKIETRNFVVPVVDLDVSARQLAGIGGGQGSPVMGAGGGLPAPPAGNSQLAPPPRELPPGETPAGPPPPPAPSWRPVDQQALAPAPFVSVADQLDEVKKTPKPRKNAATPIKPTGVTPRKAADNVCHLCGEPYGEGALKKNPSTEGTRFVHVTCAETMETPADPPAAPGGKEGGGGGTPAGSTGGPAPTAGARAMSHSMHKKLMAVTAEAFPVDPAKTTGTQADADRRANVIAIAKQLGYTIGSRTDLTAEQGSEVIDALTALRDGTYKWDGQAGVLIEAETGVVVGAK